MLSCVAQGLKASRVTLTTEGGSASSTASEILKQVLEHAKISGVADLLCLCLEISGQVVCRALRICYVLLVKPAGLFAH